MAGLWAYPDEDNLQKRVSGNAMKLQHIASLLIMGLLSFNTTIAADLPIKKDKSYWPQRQINRAVLPIP
jgi:hypothetical protein